MNSFNQLFLANLKVIYRNKPGLFWTIAVPVALYVALAALPIPELAGQLAYKNFVLPGVIAYVIMQGGVYTLAYWMVDLKSRGVIKRFLVTPIKSGELALSLIAARLSVIFAQTILITAIGLLFFHAQFAGNIVSIIFLIILGGAIFLQIGLLISNFANSYETAAPITAAIGMPFALVGNLFVPLDVLPKTLQIIAHALPITYLADGLRQAYLYPFNFNTVGLDILILALWAVTMFAATLSVFKLKE